MKLAHHVPLCIATRGGAAENIHNGSVAVVDEQGRCIAYAGDADALTFGRSTLKPFQASFFVESGGADHLGLEAADLAILCASHSGESCHTERVERLLARLGLDARALQCGTHVPMRWSAFDLPPPPEASWSALHHNCSGKHAGFLAACRFQGWPQDSYLDPLHPLQQTVRRFVADYTDCAPDDLVAGIDGCSAPVYGLPLQRLALGYARLAAPCPGFVHQQAARALFQSMTRYPELISGQGRSDLAFVECGAGNWVAKIGVDGVQCLGLRTGPDRSLGIAIKLGDGNMRALYSVAVEVLHQLGLLNGQESRLEALHHPSLRNARGRETGEIRPVFELTWTGVGVTGNGVCYCPEPPTSQGMSIL